MMFMKPMIFRCPATGELVQCLVAEEADTDEGNVWETVTCLACGRLHPIDRQTGTVLGQKV